METCISHVIPIFLTLSNHGISTELESLWHQSNDILRVTRPMIFSSMSVWKSIMIFWEHELMESIVFLSNYDGIGFTKWNPDGIKITLGRNYSDSRERLLFFTMSIYSWFMCLDVTMQIVTQKRPVVIPIMSGHWDSHTSLFRSSESHQRRLSRLAQRAYIHDLCASM